MPTLAHNLHVLVSVMDRRADTLLAEASLPLTFRRFLLLTHVHDLDGPSQRELAEAVGLSEAAVSRMVAGLVKDDLVLVAQAGRRRMITLTTAGYELWVDAGRVLGDSFDHAVCAARVDPARLADDVRAVLDLVRTAPSERPQLSGSAAGHPPATTSGEI